MSGRVAAVETFHIAIPLPRPLRLASIVISQREYVIVRVRDEDGRAGTAIGLARSAPIAATVLRTVAPTLVGSCLGSYGETYQRVVAANVCLGTNGIFWRALSLVDCAVHDLLGRRSETTLADYFGCTARPVPCVLVGGYPLPDESRASLVSEMELLSEFQPAGIKIGSCGDPARDTQRLACCREAMPGGPPLMIDLYWQVGAVDAWVDHAARWADFGMGWIEDPVAFDDYGGAAFLAGKLPYPVAIGDEQCGLRHFERLMDHGRVGVIRLDATVCGGVTGFRAIARAAAERGLPVACHIFPEMHVQIAALEPNVKWVESFVPDSGLDVMDRVIRSGISLTGGCMPPSTQHGFGIDWDEEALQRYRVQDTCL